MDNVDKPPIGIVPEKYWIEARFGELSEACNRFMQADKPIPSEWKDEMIRHYRRIKFDDQVGADGWMRFFGRGK